MKMFKEAVIWGLGVLTGVLAGLWGASLTYPCLGLCLAGFPALTTWQSCLVGAIVGSVIPMLAIALDDDFMPRTRSASRSVWRFLFEDLSRHQVQ